MPGFGMLIDTFDDGLRDPVLWSGSYGDVVEAVGRARVPCTTAYSGWASAPAYSLAQTQVACRVYPPAAGGATVEALAEVLVLTGAGGTDAGFSINAVTGQMRLVSRVGYADPNELALTYDATAHAWVRLRAGDASLYWDTSPDGRTWTVRRTAASPGWVTDQNLGVVLAAHRDSGLGDYAEFDSFNLTRPGQLAGAVRTSSALAPLARTGPTMSGG